MKKAIIFCLLAIHNISFAQIKNFEDESQYLLALQGIVSQSYLKQHSETGSNEEGTRHFLEFDPMSMNLVFYKTPYDEDDNGKLPTDIQWLTKSVIPLYEIDVISFTEKKNMMTIKMKDNKPSIQSYMIMSGNEYYPATKEKEINIHSDKVAKIRNIAHRLNWRISELQKFHQKKMDLVNYLNKKLKQEVEYQRKDTLNYPADRKFKLIQEFQLDNSGQWLSIIVERENYYGNPLTEKQSVRLKDITEVIKDINVILKSKDNSVLKITTIINENAEKEDVETVDNLFFIQLCYKKNNEHIGSEILYLFKQIGLSIQKKDWYD